MKVLFNLTCAKVTQATGIERFALHLAQEFIYFAPSTIMVASEQLPSIADAVIPKSLYWSRSLSRNHEYMYRVVWDQAGLRRLLAKHHPDVVFFPIQDGLLFPPVKQIVTVHDLQYLHFGNSMPECRHEIGFFRTKLYMMKMPLVLKGSSAVVTVSESTKQELVNFFGINSDKVHVIYNGYDQKRFRPVENVQPALVRYDLRKDEYFLCVGSILKHKNIHRVVQAFATLKSQAKLVIAGTCKDSGYLDEIWKAAEDIGVHHSRVLYLEYIPDEELPLLYNGALALVLPSLHEGFGVPIIEAMACGTPVITSNCSAMPEVAGGAALLVDPYSVEDIAAAMREICRNPQRTQALRHAGLERCKSFTWSHSARKLYDVCTMVSES